MRNRTKDRLGWVLLVGGYVLAGALAVRVATEGRTPDQWRNADLVATPAGPMPRAEYQRLPWRLRRESR